MFDTETAAILGGLAGLILTIILYIKILPKKLDGTFTNSKAQWLHNFFHFKKLYLEEIIRFTYVLSTVTCVCVGACLVLGYQEVWGWRTTTRESTALIGIIVMVVGPIALRLTYEGIMMLILLVKNTMEINNKLPDATKATETTEN